MLPLTLSALRLRLVSGEMQMCEQQMARLEHGDLGGLRFLTFTIMSAAANTAAAVGRICVAAST